MSGLRYTAAELERLLRRCGSKAVRLVDLRTLPAHRRAHPRGAAPIPAARLNRSLYLLPPRDRPLVLITRSGADAEAWARRLLERGWIHAGWLDGSPRDLDARLLARGTGPNRIWDPAPLLRHMERELPRRGRACDLACGSGRNTVFLALRGLDVVGLDILPDALRQARGLARAARVPPPGRAAFHRADLTEVSTIRRRLRPGRFRVLTCFRYLDRTLLPDLVSTLAPGGWLLYETFLEEQARRGRKPTRAAFLLKPGELRSAFPELEVVYYREGQDAEGNWLASLAGRRPGRKA